MTDFGNINSAPLIAFHGSQNEKDAILEQLQQHAAADEITKGIYWEHGRGCAVGCTIHGDDHALYESRFGIPQMLALLEDTIFEGLPNDSAKAWPIRFMEAIRPGADLSHVGWQFLHRLLIDETLNPGISHPIVKQAVADVAALVAALAKGDPVDASAAKSAAESADSAAESARSARYAAKSAESATWAAWAAESAAEDAAYSAENARSAVFVSVGSAAAYVSMSNVLIQLFEAA